MARRFQDVACTGCGCVCDDLQINVEAGRVISTVGACHRVEEWFQQLDTQHPPLAEIEGRSVDFAAALERAACLLAASRNPLIYGLSRSSTDGQRAAVRLADQLGAVIDTTASRCHGPSIVALQTVGESTGSLGEFKTRADLVIYWGANPLVSHPRHLERYAVDSTGALMPSAQSQRRLFVIDIKPHETAQRADEFLQVAAGRDFELIWALRAALRQQPLGDEPVAGVPVSEVRRLAEVMRTCRSGVVFFGLGLTQQEVGHATVTALLQLVADLNAHTRFYARRLRILGDVSGADSVLCWQTGFPFSVNLNRGYPRFNPGEFSASDVLERDDVDAALLIGSESIETLTDAAQARLKSLPTIALDSPNTPRDFVPTVRFTTGIYGVHFRGTAYRMDEVPIPLKVFLQPSYPSDAAVLNQLCDSL